MDEKLYSKALRFLTLRPRTEKEVYNFLVKQKSAQNQIQEIITNLKKQKFIDDKAFASQWVEERMRLKPKGWRVLAIELRQKGISEEIIKNYEISFHQDNGMQEEEDAIQSLVAKKILKYIGKSNQEIYRKLGGFLLRRGFSFSDSKRAIDEALKKHV